MEILSDDPSVLVGGLAIVAVIFLAMLRITQQGKYLFWALSAGGLALILLALDWLWVTDNERIESVVYDLRRAVMKADVEGVAKHLDPDVQFDMSGRSRGFYYERGSTVHGQAVIDTIRGLVQSARFDFLRINSLVTQAGAQSRRGTAEFHVVAAGTIEHIGFHGKFGAVDSVWSLGLRETSPNVWKVERISAVTLPDDAQRLFPQGDRESVPRRRLPDSAKGRAKRE
jgi:hypothetical protein